MHLNGFLVPILLTGEKECLTGLQPFPGCGVAGSDKMYREMRKQDVILCWREKEKA